MKLLKIDFTELNKKLELNRKICFKSNRFIGVNYKYEIKCLKCGHTWFAIYNDVMGKRKRGCPVCGGSMKLSFDVGLINEKLKGRNIECLSKNEDYINGNSKLIWHCLVCNHNWESIYKSVIRGRGCPKCAIKNRSGENHYRWKGGNFKNKKRIEDYNMSLIDWNKISKNVRNRDNYTCQKCGNVGKLNVHHIIPARYSLSKEYISREENLITLCDSCHMKIEFKWYDYVEPFRNYLSRQYGYKDYPVDFYKALELAEII